MTIRLKAVEQGFTVGFQFYPAVCNFGNFINFGLGIMGSGFKWVKFKCKFKWV